MAKRHIRIPRDRSQERHHFILEKYRIEKYFPFLQCDLHRERLTCHGAIIPSEGCDSYELKISYVRGGIPAVFIASPLIEPRTEYHIYKEGNLCLYDWRETPWRAKMKIHETILPWTAEWLVFYELWKLTGKWQGAASEHGANDKGQQAE